VFFTHKKIVLSLPKKGMFKNPLLLSLVKYVLGSELFDYFDLIALEEIGETYEENHWATIRHRQPILTK
jgi:hypothetical protein